MAWRDWFRWRKAEASVPVVPQVAAGEPDAMVRLGLAEPVVAVCALCHKEADAFRRYANDLVTCLACLKKIQGG